jgi:TIR domain
MQTLSSTASGQNLVFVSYSHADSKWLDRLRVHLKPLERDGVMTLWDDTRIRPGTLWREEIESALEHARVAVLLITADFLASDFITTNELPPLLKAAEERGTLILPIIVKPCRFEQTRSLARFQAVNSPSEPLISYRAARREQVFVKVSGLIHDALESAPIGTARASTTAHETGVAAADQPGAAEKVAGSRAPEPQPLRPVGDGVHREVRFGDYTIRELDSGTIAMERGGLGLTPVKPHLRALAAILEIGLRNRNGNPLNTRQLGSLVIDRIEERASPRDSR